MSDQDTLRDEKLLIVAVDLAGYTRAVRDRPSLEVARFLDDFYAACAEALEGVGGRIVKFMGDGCLCVFSPDRAVDALVALDALRDRSVALAASHRMRVELGANLHIATVAAGEIGPGSSRRFDVIGYGVNHAFLMGGAAGFRITEPVYRQLPNELRGPWRKRRPPAVYTLRD